MSEFLYGVITGFCLWPILLYIGFPLLKKWLVKKWKLEPKKEKAENEH